MSAYGVGGWENFFVAEAGVAAAFSGLLFVAVSINLSRILSFPHLPGRAASALVVLLSLLVVASLGLVPCQPPAAYALELVATGLVATALTVRLQLPGIDRKMPRSWGLMHVGSVLVSTVPFAIAGASLLRGAGGGLYWVVAATLGCLLSSALHTWVLLVEIQR